MKSAAPDKRFESWLSIALVIFVGLITYAPLLSQLGFYRDDWYLIWTAQSQGAQGILNLFKGDRPFLGWLYVFDYNLLGSSPLNWHIYALIIKIIGALGFLWFMRSLWPNRKIETTFIALLFLVYPGFYQQPNAATFKNLLLAYAAAMFSLAFTIQALKAQSSTHRVLWMISAVLLAAFYIFIYEALVGLEAARFLLIWYFWNRQRIGDWKLTLRRSVFEALPYLLFTAAFVFWRIFLFESTRRATNVDVVFSQYTSFHNLARLFIETFKDLIETTFLAWGVPYYQFTVQQAEYRVTGMGLLLGILAVGAAGVYHFLSRGQVSAGPEAEDSRDGLDWILLGALIIVVTTFPIVLSGRNVIFGVQWDRYTYQSLLGVALFAGGIIFYVTQNMPRWVLFSALLLVGVSTQFYSAEYYRTFWSLERNAIWQLSWRAPQIEDGANLVIVLPESYRFAEEYEIWGPVSLAYHPSDALRLTGQVIFDSLWVDMMRGTLEERLVRGTIEVQRDYGKTIILSQPSLHSCLHVLDESRAEQSISESFDVQAAASYSRAQLIDVDASPSIPLQSIFGAEPVHDWCYYYQKMDLARQRMDWETAASLADEAISQGLSPNDLTEWLPALEAYIHVNDTKQSRRIATLIRVNKVVYQSLCTQMRLRQDQPATYDRQLLFDTLCVRNQ
jgi:hypothetical protein